MARTFDHRIARHMARLPSVRSPVPAGLAFVTFAEKESADEALEALDGTPSLVVGCNMFLDFAQESSRSRYDPRRQPLLHAPRLRAGNLAPART